MGESLQDLLSRHRAAARDCHGRSCCAQLNELIRDLEHLTPPALTRSQMHARIIAQEERP